MSRHLQRLRRTVSVKDMLKKLFKYCFKILEKPLSFFITFHSRPKRANQVGVWSDTLVAAPEVAIVLQGPILKDEDFTLETIRLYKKIFKNTLIILSTWESEEKDTAYIEKVRQEISEIIFNKAPEYGGPSNINFQILSTNSGIRRAKELGVQYVLKTRTDQRMYGVNSLEFLHNLIKQFPVTHGSKQQARIIGVSLNCFKFRLYDLSDMLQFGQIDDMLLYWAADPERDTTMAVKDKIDAIFSGLKIAIPEVYFATEFLKKVGHTITWTLADSWQAFADRFCVVDEESVDLYWYKYARMKEHRYVRYSEMRNDQEMSFKEWFNIYVGLHNKQPVDLGRIIRVIP